MQAYGNGLGLHRTLSLTLFLALLAFAGCRTPLGTEDPPPSEPEPEPPTEEASFEPAIDVDDFERPIIEERESASRPLRGLAKQAAEYGATAMRIEGEPGLWLVAKGERELLLREKSRQAILEGKVVYLDRPLERRRGAWQLSDSDVRVVLESVFRGIELALPRPLIAIDPGHGGNERGAVNESLGLVEKNLALEVSRRMRERLEERGFRTALTRYDDRLVSLEERSEIASRAGASLFVSIHFNAAENLEAAGVETYFLTPADQPSTSEESAGEEVGPFPGNAFDQANFLFACRLQRSMVERLQRADRGVKKGRFGALKRLNAPAALVECGFLSNRTEALLVGTPVYREKLARALADAIESFYLEYASSPMPSSASRNSESSVP